MSRVRLICLGNPNAGDDGAAFRAAEQLQREVVWAGRPGPGLLDILEGEAPVVLTDVTRSGSAPGTIRRIPLAQLVDVVVAEASVSSHGFGPGEALRLGRALGRELPPGELVGIEGASFEPSTSLSRAVQAALPAFVEAIRDALAAWE